MYENKDLKVGEKICSDLLQQLSKEDLEKRAAAKDLPVQSDGKVLVNNFRKRSGDSRRMLNRQLKI